MSNIEHVRIQRLLIKYLEQCEPLSNEDWFTAVVHGKVDSQDKLADEIQRHIDRRMIAGAGEIKRLREERDEARRLACGALASGGWDLFAKPEDWGVDRGRDLCMRDQADERGWDCFKEAP